jgi:hypothetical protein
MRTKIISQDKIEVEQIESVVYDKSVLLNEKRNLEEQIRYIDYLLQKFEESQND